MREVHVLKWREIAYAMMQHKHFTCTHTHTYDDGDDDEIWPGNILL